MGLLGQAKSEGDRGDWLGVRHREIPSKVGSPVLSLLSSIDILSGNTLEMRRLRMKGEEEEEEEGLRVIMTTSAKTTDRGLWRLSGC